MRGLYACLVHESPECVVDLVRNLHYLDPAGSILLYNGGPDPELLRDGFPWHQYGVSIHPSPRRMSWGRLHGFALDSMRHALERIPFDFLTVVDSDQLALRPGYSAFIADFLRDRPGVGVLSSLAARQGSATRIAPARAALEEIHLWRPFLRRFPGGERKFVYWSFWPATVFTREAAVRLTEFVDGDGQFRRLLARSRIYATEEVLLPTLAALLGLEVAPNPCASNWIRFRESHSVAQLGQALAAPSAFWMHPVPRDYGDPLRNHLRALMHQYRRTPPPREDRDAGPLEIDFELPAEVFERIAAVEGWLDRDEATLLAKATALALGRSSRPGAVVEVGSYCGRGTIVLAFVARGLGRSTGVVAIDPHDGRIGALDTDLERRPPSLDKLLQNLHESGLADAVEVVQACAPEVRWERSISVLLIDHLHDYPHVARDFFHLEPWLEDDAVVIFHDYVGYFPGVQVLVDELLASQRYRRVDAVGSLIVLERTAAAGARRPPHPKRAPAVVTAPGRERRVRRTGEPANVGRIGQ